jgi:hypothetical protein
VYDALHRGLPLFAGMQPGEKRCANPRCIVPSGAVLSRFNGDPDGWCWTCRNRWNLAQSMNLILGAPTQPKSVCLIEMVGGLLLLQRNINPGEPLYLVEALRHYCIMATHSQINAAVRSCRLRGLDIHGAPHGCPGHYIATPWPVPLPRKRHGPRPRVEVLEEEVERLKRAFESIASVDAVFSEQS